MCFEAGAVALPQDLSLQRLSGEPTEPPPLPPPQDSPGEPPQREEPSLEIPEVQVSKNMKVHKTMVNVTVEKITRKFTVTEYGNIQLAMLAANHFDQAVGEKLKEFERLARKPAQRHELLVHCGWPKDKDSKRQLEKQRAHIIAQMSSGKLVWLEEWLCKRLVGTLLPQAKASLKAGPDGLTTVWTSQDQQVTKTFKHVHAAITWLEQMEQAKQAGLSQGSCLTTLYIYIFTSKYAHVCIYIYVNRFSRKH